MYSSLCPFQTVLIITRVNSTTAGWYSIEVDDTRTQPSRSDRHFVSEQGNLLIAYIPSSHFSLNIHVKYVQLHVLLSLFLFTLYTYMYMYISSDLLLHVLVYFNK